MASKCPDDCAHHHAVDKCRQCSVDGQTNDRLDVWQTARRAMENADWPEDCKPSPHDVLSLALFLTGEITYEGVT